MDTDKAEDLNHEDSKARSGMDALAFERLVAWVCQLSDWPEEHRGLKPTAATIRFRLEQDLKPLSCKLQEAHDRVDELETQLKVAQRLYRELYGRWVTAEHRNELNVEMDALAIGVGLRPRELSMIDG